MIRSNQELRDCDRTVQIALASDQNYFCGLLVTAVSIAEYAAADVALNYTILDGGISDESWQLLNRVVCAHHEKSTLERILVDESRFAEYPSLRGCGSKMTYARLLLPDILKCHNHVIYCDVDFLWRADIAELWTHRSDDFAMQCSKDLTRNPDGDVVEERERKWFEGNGLPFSAKGYVCVGIAIMNLKVMREENSIAKFFDFLAKHRDVIFHDQTTLNAIFYNRIGILDKKWQIFSGEVTSQHLKEPCLIHYAANTPWARFGLWCFGLTDVRLLWFEYYAKICNKSVWGALREFYVPREILVRRLVYKLAVMPVVRSIYFALLKLTGRGAYVVELQRLRKLN